MSPATPLDVTITAKDHVSSAIAVASGLAAGTMLDAPQLSWLYHLAHAAPDGPAVEVGVWKGGSIVCWARARRRRGAIYAVDNFYAHLAERPGADKTRARFLANIKEFVEASDDPAAAITWYEEMGHEGANHFEDGSVAFCFIDADHGEDGITKDLPAWVPKIMPGGIIAFHDYGVWKPTVVVKREVDQWQATAQWEPLGMVGSAIAFRRPVGLGAPT